MAAIIRFYRWLKANGLLSPQWPMWRERTIGMRLVDAFGFERTMIMSTTDLAIHNRKAPGEILEDGLLPVSLKGRDTILEFAHKHASQELALMLRIGFGTGMRFGTIADLKIETLERAVPDPFIPNYFRLVGRSNLSKISISSMSLHVCHRTSSSGDAPWRRQCRNRIGKTSSAT